LKFRPQQLMHFGMQYDRLVGKHLSPNSSVGGEWKGKLIYR